MSSWGAIAAVILACGLGTETAAAQRQIGEFQILPAVAWASEAPGQGPSEPPFPGQALVGSTVVLAFQAGALALGPEAGRYWGSERRVTTLAGVVRLRRTRGMIRPHLTGGLGAYLWDAKRTFTPPSGPPPPPFWTGDIEYFSGNLGAGLTLGHPHRTLSAAVELRGHWNLQRDELVGSRRLYSLAAGLRIVW